jgi:beta-lactamase superfamily II metal-dependent hydrolase
MDISDRSNLLVQVYVIGYSERGESILILFVDKGDDNRILYSLVIDSFKYKGIQKTTDLMNKYGIKDQKLNMLVWSHPDYDHTYGLQEILNCYCDENTRVVLPYDLNGKAWNKVDYNKEDATIIDKVLSLTKRKHLSHQTAAVSDELYQPMQILMLEDGLGKLPIAIHAISPHSSRINYMLEAHKTMKKNDLSIALLIEIGNFNTNTNKFLFMADTENDDIDMLYPLALDNPLFVKIPHHGSSSSDRLPSKFQKRHGKLPLACTTIYKAQGLPEQDVLKAYRQEFLQVDCTGRSTSKSKNFGIVEYIFDLYDRQKVDVHHHGHAHIIDDDYMQKLDKMITKKQKG